jgi:pectinesterase
MRAFAILWAALAAACGGRAGSWRAPDAPAERADYVVAADGSAGFRTIQAALDAIPEGNATERTVLVRNGTYREKVYVTKSHVAIVGEDRERTRIVFAELRKNWRASHPDDWGAAVVNVGPEVTDLTIGNLTVHNDYGGEHDHQFAIRSSGNATRIALLSANFYADGGDTVSLWNSVSGLTYYADCSFSGYVDYVCPRGWAYVTGSRFFGHNLTASLWHDGSKDPDQKLVVRRSHFDGVPGFPLGRHNRDGQIYVLDSVFSERMADRPIYLAGDPATFQWGLRTFFANDHREGGDYTWFADNLERAPGAPRPEDVTPAWTFGGRWDPEASLPAVLPFAALPRPESGTAAVDPRGIALRWTPGRNARSQRLHFGTERDPPLRAAPAGSTFQTGPLREGATYSWRVDTVTGAGLVRGPEWSFDAGARAAPSRKETRR